MESSLAMLLVIGALIQAFLFVLFGRFVAPRSRVFAKTAFYLLITWILASGLGWWSLAWIFGHPALDVFAHVFWCGNNGIDWRTCEPREKYLRLRPWALDENLANADRAVR